jgi:hypothetical protein
MMVTQYWGGWVRFGAPGIYVGHPSEVNHVHHPRFIQGFMANPSLSAFTICK